MNLERRINTRGANIQILARLHRHCGRPLDELGSEDVRNYLRILIRSPVRVSAPYPTLIAAVRICFIVTLSRHEVVAGLCYPRAPRKFPVILTQAGILRRREVQMSERNRALIMLGYGAGMRSKEAARSAPPYMKKELGQMLGELVRICFSPAMAWLNSSCSTNSSS